MHLSHGFTAEVGAPGLSKICIFSALYLPSMGGVERFTDGLAHELAREGHQVVVVTNNTHEGPDYEVTADGFEVLRLPCLNVLGGRYPVPIPNREYRQMMRRLEGRSFDGVLVNTRFYIHSLLGVRLARKKGLRAVVLDHGSAYLTLGNGVLDWCIARYEGAITTLLKRKPVDFYGISQKSVEWLAHFGIKAKGVISNSIDAAAYRDQASDRSFREELSVPFDALMMSFTGRFVPEKGINVLIGMMRELKDEPVHLVMAGEGPLLTDVEQAGLERIHVVGRLGAPDIAALLLESDVFCLPSRSEGFSTSLLEAAACGTPSLVTDVGGARELAPSEDYGFVLKAADSRSFASAVFRCLGDRESLKQMGLRCFESVEARFSWQAVSQRLLVSFESAEQDANL